MLRPWWNGRPPYLHTQPTPPGVLARVCLYCLCSLSSFRRQSNYRSRRRDLLQEPIDGIFRSRLEERRDGEGGDGAVGVGDERLEILVALGRILLFDSS